MSPQSMTLPQKLKGLDFMGLFSLQSVNAREEFSLLPASFCLTFRECDLHVIPAAESDLS